MLRRLNDLAIFDAIGHQIRVLMTDAEVQKGTGTATWDGRDESGVMVANGTYFCRLQNGDVTEVEPLLLAR